MMHAEPIQARATTKTTVRTGTGANEATTITTLGNAHTLK